MPSKAQNKKRRSEILIGLLLFCFTAKAQAAVLDAKSLKRVLDSVTVRGTDLNAFLGTKIQFLNLYAFRDGVFAAIPFQVDRKDKNGLFVFLKADPELEPLHEQDELVFMAKDTGDRISLEDWPENRKQGVEIQAKDPVNGFKGWVYLFSFDSVPKRSSEDYVHYNAQEQKILAASYVVGFSDDAPISFNMLAITPEAGGTGEDIVDRLKIRISARTFIGLSFEKTEKDFEAKVTAIKDGPVRVIRRSEYRITMYRVFTSPTAVCDQVYYSGFFEFPVGVDLNFDLNTVLTKATFQVTTDQSTPTDGYFYNENNLSGAAIDGKMTEEEKKLNLAPYNWSSVANKGSGKEACWLNRLILKTSPGVEVRLSYMDDQSLLDPPEEYPGQLGNIGYTLTNFQALKKGSHRITSILYILPRYSEEEVQTGLNVLDRPLQTLVGKGYSEKIL